MVIREICNQLLFKLYCSRLRLSLRSGLHDRVLKCISYVVVPYKPTKEGGGFKEKGDFMYHGDHNTDFEHPGCGGTFYEKADNVRLNCIFESRFYKSDGSFIES